MKDMMETWIIYKTETMDAPDWEKRQLMPSGSLTDILGESWDFSGELPQAGDRLSFDKSGTADLMQRKINVLSKKSTQWRGY